MSLPLPKPSPDTRDAAAALVDYLDYFRSEIRRKVTGLDDDALHTSTVPSGWTPAELVNHLVHMERRWIVWGFLGEHTADPWGDQDESGRWKPRGALEGMLTALDAGGARTRDVVAHHALHELGSDRGRFTDGTPPTLLAVLLHVEQEYARHVGHLDIARELGDGLVGEG